MKQALFIIGGIIMILFFLVYTSMTRDEANQEALIKLNLHMTGVVENVQNGDNFHGYGIVRLKVLSTNIQHYDPRGKLKYYFCVIKDGTAEVYDHASHNNTSVGDTLIYDTGVMRGIYKRQTDDPDSGSIGVSTEDAYYCFIERKTIFKK